MEKFKLDSIIHAKVLAYSLILGSFESISYVVTLFNILRGYIRVWTFQLVIKDTGEKITKVNKESIVNMFHRNGLLTYDYVEYSGNRTGGILQTGRERDRHGFREKFTRQPVAE